jgi:hypothetical protein
VAVNRLQSEKVIVCDDKDPQASRDPIASAVRHGHKLLFPTYDGADDPLPWLNRCEQFFRIQDTQDTGKVFLASFYMTGDAAQWYALVEHNRGSAPTWEEFVKLVNQRFGPPLRGTALGELIQLCRESTVAEYQSQFLALVSRCEGLIEKHHVDIFTACLGNPLKTDVELEHPTTLEDVMALARTYEQRLADASSARTTLHARAAPVRTPSAPTKPMLLTGPPPANSSKDTARSAPPCFKRLTPAKMVAKRERGECYNCTKKFSQEHLKVCPVKGVFLLQLDDVSFSDEDETEDPQISLNAITGISPAETLQLFVRVARATLSALVDSGSTKLIRRLNDTKFA